MDCFHSCHCCWKHAVTLSFLRANMVRVACCLILGCLALCCAISMSMLSQTPFVSYRPIRLLCSTDRWSVPRYFEYDIVNGPANTRVDPWQPVADSTLKPAPDSTSTYREWRRFYHFEVYWPRDSTGGTTLDSFSQPVSYASFYTWQYRDWHTRGYQRLGNPHPNIARPVFRLRSPDLMRAGLSSSSTLDLRW